MDKVLNQRTSETQANVKFAVSSGFRMHDGAKIAIHVPVTSREKKKKRKRKRERLHCSKVQWLTKVRHGRKDGRRAQVGTTSSGEDDT